MHSLFRVFVILHFAVAILLHIWKGHTIWSSKAYVAQDSLNGRDIVFSFYLLIPLSLPQGNRKVFDQSN